MAYRKQWYTYGIRNTASMDSLPVSVLQNGDTAYNTDTRKPEYVFTPSYAANSTSDKIWMNEDCVYADDLDQTTRVGNVVLVRLDVYSGAGNSITWIGKCGTGVARYAGQFFGVVCRMPVGSSELSPSFGRAVAIQGIYNVKFTAATTNVTAGNYAVISATAGEASQGGSTASTGAIGVIMETKDLGVDKLAKVMIQTFSSR